MKSIYKLLPIVCLLLYGVMQGQQVTKNIQHLHHYKTVPNTSIEIENKYGNIDVTNWDKDSVKIIVDVSLTAKNQDKLNRLITYTNVDFVHTGDFVSAKTRLGTSKLTTGISVLIDDSFGASDITIKYTVFVPTSSQLNITNSFGDIYLHSRKGKTIVDLSHGSIRAGILESQLELKASYSKLKIKQAVDIDFELKHCSDVEVQKANDIKLNSSYSSVTIRKANKIHLNSKKDNIEIEEVNTLYGDCSLPNIYVERLEKRLGITTKMIGSIKINEVSASFDRIEINTDYTSIDLKFLSSDFGFKMEHKSSTLTYPSYKAVLKTIDSTTQKNVRITTGTFGENPLNKTVSIAAEDSDITFTFY